MATKHVEYSRTICVFKDTKCLFMLRDIDNNWELLLLTSCSLLTLYVDLVGGMGIGEANHSQIGQHNKLRVSSFFMCL